ncbi:unnamed protein product, partial [Musa hybrid cultivar]
FELYCGCIWGFGLVGERLLVEFFSSPSNHKFLVFQSVSLLRLHTKNLEQRFQQQQQ